MSETEPKPKSKSSLKKILLIVAGVFGLVLLIVFGLAATKPDVIQVERKLVMQGTPEDVFPYANDLSEFTKWMPWSELDPEQTIEYSDPPSGVGAWYTWKGNDDVGSGRMEVLEAEPDKVVHRLQFMEPFESEAKATLSMQPVGDDQVEVTWGFEQDANFATKIMCVFVDMDSMLGADFEKGLANLGRLVEAGA